MAGRGQTPAIGAAAIRRGARRYPDPVASDYPDCLKIVEEKVKPEREANRYSKSARERWWLYERLRGELYATVAGLDRVLVKSEVGNTLSFAFMATSIVFSHMLIVYAFEHDGSQALLQSWFHEVWAREYSSSMRT